MVFDFNKNSELYAGHQRRSKNSPAKMAINNPMGMNTLDLTDEQKKSLIIIWPTRQKSSPTAMNVTMTN